MTFNNNSRNIANLLRFQQLQPIKQSNQSNQQFIQQSNQLSNQQRISNIQAPSRQRQPQQLPIQEVFTPDDNLSEKRNSRRMAPLSSQGNNRNEEYNRMSKRNDIEFESLKIRLDQIIKYYDQRNVNIETKLMVRINELQNFVMKEVPKIDNTIMVASEMAGFKEMIKEVRRQQEMQVNEINSLKAMSRERNNTESLMAQTSKDKEKLTVLFMEMVRLGDTIQKITDQMNSSTRGYEGRIQDLEQKLMNSQKNLSIISQRTSSGSDVLNEFGDKLMTRLQSAESNLLILGKKQQIRQRESMTSITSQNERIGDDINTMIMNMQTDFQNKLQNRMNETLNRLMSEHQQRIRHQEDIRKNLDIMERIQMEKQQSDKLENHARLNDMDAAVRNEFLKKEESIRGLQAAMEQHFRTLANELNLQGGKRKEQQTAFRFELKKVQQGFRKEYDLSKNHQSELIDKMTDLIKSQIQSRTLQEQDLKRITAQVGKIIADDLNNLKEAVSVSNKKLNMSLKQVSNESSERAGQLSHYIDNEVKKVVDVVTQKYSKMKNVFTKLAEQFKNHLVNTETNRKNHESRLVAVEEDFEKLKAEVNTEIDEFYNDLEARLKEEKEFVQTVVFKKTNQLTLRVNKLEEYTNQYFDVLKTGIQDNKDLLSRNMKTSTKGEDSEEEIKQLRTIIFEMKKLTEELKHQNTESYRKLDKEINGLEEKTKETIVELTNSINAKIVKNTEKTTDIEHNLSQLTVKVNSLRAESGSETAISADRVKKMADELSEVKQKVKENQQTIHSGLSKSDEELIRLKSDITVLKGEVGALDDDIKKLSKVEK